MIHTITVTADCLFNLLNKCLVAATFLLDLIDDCINAFNFARCRRNCRVFLPEFTYRNRPYIFGKKFG